MASSATPRYMSVTPRVTGLDQFASDVAQVATLVQQANQRIARQAANIQPFRFDTAAVTRNLGEVTSRFTTFWRTFDARQNMFTSFGRSLSAIGRQLRYFAFDFERLGRTMSIAFTLPLVAAGTAVAKWGSEFEQALKKVEVLVNQNEETVARWGNEILTTMTGLGQSPLELAEGLYFAASAFGSLASQAPVMDVLRASAAGATVGLGNMEDVTRLVTASMNAYESSMLGASEAMYVLIRTVTEGQFEADKLASSLGRVLGTATALKIPFRDLVTYVAGVTRLGEEPSRIITSLNSALLKILTPTSKANEIMERYGYTLEGIKKTLAGPGGLYELLNSMRDVMPDQALGALFTTRASRTIFAVTDALRDDIAEIQESMTEDEKKRLHDIEAYNKAAAAGVSGAWVDAWGKSLDAEQYYADLLKKQVINTTNTVSGQFKILKDTIQTIGINAFQGVIQKPLLDFLKDLNERMIEFNNTVRNNPKTVKAVFAIGAALAALGPGIIIVSRLVQAFNVLIETTGFALRAIGSIAGTVVNVAVRSFGLLGTTMLNVGRIAYPVVLAFARLGTVIGAAVVPAVASLIATMGSSLVSGFVAFFGTWRSWMVSLNVSGAVFGVISSAVSGLGTALGAVGSALGFVGGMMPVLLSSAAAAAGGVGLLIAAFGGLLVAAGKVKQKIKPVAEKIGDVFTSLKDESSSWGEGLMAEYSNGIIRGIAYVVRALTSVAKVITSLLRPSSPPKILPEIDEWGKGTMETWLAGWGKADFSILKDIIGDVRSYLENVIDEDDDAKRKGIVAQMILGSQKALIDAVNSVKNTGQVAKEALENIFSSLGTTTPALRGYIQAQLEVAAATDKLTKAQDKLTAASKRYDDLLKPLNRKLDNLNAKEEERQRAMREDILKNLLEQEIPEEVRIAANLELDTINTERQIARLESARDATLAPLQDSVDAAQEQLDLAQQQLDFYSGLMDLQSEQADLLEAIKDAIKDAADKLEKALKEKALTDYGQPEQIDIAENLDIGGAGAGIDLSGITGDLDMQLDNLMGEIEDMKFAWIDMMDAARVKWLQFQFGTLNPIMSKVKNFYNRYIKPVGKALGEGADEAARVWDEEIGGIVDVGIDWSILGENEQGETLPQYVRRLFQEAFGDWTLLDVVTALIGTVNETLIPGFASIVQGAIDLKNSFGNYLLQSLVDVQTFMTGIRNFLLTPMGTVFETLTMYVVNFATFIGGKLVEVNNFINTIVLSILGFATNVGSGIASFVASAFQKFLDFGARLGELLTKVENFKLLFRNKFALIGLAITAVMTKFQAMKEDMEEKMGELKTSVGLLKDKFAEFRDYMEEKVKKVISDVKDKIDEVTGGVGLWKTALLGLVSYLTITFEPKLIAVAGFIGGIQTAFSNLVDYMENQFASALSSLSSALDSFISKIESALAKALRLIGLDIPGSDDESGNTSGPSSPGLPGEEKSESMALPSMESFANEALFTGSASNYPVNTSPFRNMPSVYASGISSAISSMPQRADESVKIRVEAGGQSAIDGGVIVNFGDVTISNGMEFAEFESRVERVIVRSLTR